MRGRERERERRRRGVGPANSLWPHIEAQRALMRLFFRRGGGARGGGGGRARGAGNARRGTGVQIQQRADIGLVGSGHGIAFIDEAQEERFLEPRDSSGGFGEGEEGDGRGAEGDAVDALEASREEVELAFGLRGEHVGVQEAGDGAAGRVAGHEEGTAAAGGVFFEEGAQPGGDWGDHFARDGEEA